MLSELIEKQKELDSFIQSKFKLQNDDLYEKKKIALLVELAELANELRFFKYWSKDQRVRTFLLCEACNGTGEMAHLDDRECVVCWGSGENNRSNPALEEYVDCIHLVLSITIDHPIYYNDKITLEELEPLYYPSMVTHFNILFAEISNSLYTNLEFILKLILGIGELVGFTEEEIKKAYLSKHEENYARQRRGY